MILKIIIGYILAKMAYGLLSMFGRWLYRWQNKNMPIQIGVTYEGTVSVFRKNDNSCCVNYPLLQFPLRTKP